MQNSPQRDRSRNRKPDQKLSPPPIQNFIFWAIVFCSVPAVILLFNKSGSNDKISQKQFEGFLLARQVKTAIISPDDAGGVSTITGKYQPKVGADVAQYRVKVLMTSDLLDLIRKNVDQTGDWDVEPSSSLFTQVLMPLIPILILVVIIYFIFTRQLRNAGKGAIQFGKSRARMVQSLERITFADVAGINEAKEEVEEIIDYLKDPDKFHRLGGQMPKGVLMVGPPGTGKTLLAKAIAGEADVPFFNISGSDFVEMFVGVGASRVRDMFEQGKKHAPCIIFIDEIDAVGRSRFSGIGGGHDEREQTLNALLVEMDGFEGKSGVIVIAATNRPDVLDPALLRPGRFDRQVTIDLPDLSGRLDILKVHVKKIKLADKVDLNITARGTAGFSGADLHNLVNEAALLAARKGKNAVEIDDMEEARDKVMWGKERRSRMMDEKLKRVTAYHEAGHALVGLYCEHAMPLHKVSIIPRGSAMLGAAMYLPDRDVFSMSRSELRDQIAVTMGGRVAEEIVFGECDTGASMDIKQATNLARKMVCEWGMSEKMGMVRYGDREEHIYLGRDITRNIDYSEQTARELDVEIRNLVDEAYNRAQTILTDNRDRLELFGKTLIERETMDVKEIRELLDLPAPKKDEEEANAEKPPASWPPHTGWKEDDHRDADLRPDHGDSADPSQPGESPPPSPTA